MLDQQATSNAHTEVLDCLIAFRNLVIEQESHINGLQAVEPEIQFKAVYDLLLRKAIETLNDLNKIMDGFVDEEVRLRSRLGEWEDHSEKSRKGAYH